jgi:hypothetical protein
VGIWAQPAKHNRQAAGSIQRRRRPRDEKDELIVCMDTP